jgi:5'-3' exonuclease
VNKRPPRNGEPRAKIQNTLLVDGNALFKVSYFGAKNMYNHNGVHIGGLYSFITTLRKILTEELYHKVYVFWDGDFSGKLRYEIYQPYKSGRGKDYINGTKPTDESELAQQRRVWKYLNEMCIRQIKDEVVESDDFIAYYCLNKEENEKITIMSGDRDFLQLLSPDVRIYFLDLKTYVDLSNYSSYFCFNQMNSVLMKVMTGDSSDSIKGIKGLGETKLLALFPELKDRKLSLNEIIDIAKKQQADRIEKKQPPLKVLDNIIQGVTDGVQKERVYEINQILVDLKQPLMTEAAIRELETANESEFGDDRELRKVFTMMKEDGLDKAIGEPRYPEYLVPFKKLIGRENFLTF